MPGENVYIAYKVKYQTMNIYICTYREKLLLNIIKIDNVL